MAIFGGFNISASALTAQRLRMDIASANIANTQTTRSTVNENGEVVPYRRKMVALQSEGSDFRTYLHRARYGETKSSLQGVRVSRIVEDDEPFKLVFEPNHPDANEAGYVQYPNVDPLKEMVDIISASRSYEANITALNGTKDMLLKTLEIGK